MVKSTATDTTQLAVFGAIWNHNLHEQACGEHLILSSNPLAHVLGHADMHV